MRSLTPRLSILVVVLVALTLYAAAPTPGYAASKTSYPTIETPPAIKEATVNLYCQVRSGNKTYSASGTGVFIDEAGVILTNAHVAQYFLLQGEHKKIKGSCAVRSGSPAREQYRATVLYIPPAWLQHSIAKTSGTGEDDFALLLVTGVYKKGTLPSSFPALPFTTTSFAEVDDAVSITGYPTEKLNFDKVKRKLALVTASSTVTNTQYYTYGGNAEVITLAPSAAGSHGVSGGPVVSPSGTLLGIVTSKSAAKDDRALRAISLPYIDARIRAHTFLPLSYMLSSNLAAQASTTAAGIESETLDAIRKGLTKKK